MDELNAKVKSKFQLFQGVRSQEEDQKIYDKVMDLISDESTKFIIENLTEEDLSKMEGELKSADTEENRLNIMTTYFAKVDNYSFRFNQRVNGFLDNLVTSSIKNLNFQQQQL